MRKDVKLAFVVGGILISVLVVYVLVVPGSQKRPDRQAVTLEETKPQAAAPSSSEKTNTPAVAEKTEAPKVEEKPAEGQVAQGPTTKPTDPFASASGKDSSDLWMAALNRGSVPMMTSAPQPTPPQLPKALIARTSEASQTTQAPVSSSTADNSSTTRPSGPEAAPVQGDMRTHVVARGETIAKIAEAAYGSQNYWPHIIRANPGIVAEKIRPGMTINLPPESEVKGTSTNTTNTTAIADSTTLKPDTTSPKVDTQSQYEVQSGDSLHKIAMKLYGSSAKWQAIYDANKDVIGPDPAKVKAKSVLKLPEPPTVKQQ